MAGFWIRINPNGCVIGSVYASVLETDDARGAHEEFTPAPADRDRESAEGYRHERVHRLEWQRRAKPCLLRQCNHQESS
ncbi:hypothetical protein [Streptomyces sp. NPDC056242]|uniref:hypothetical protein n=1 Tax=Streptomyces sp. NPDC056242 TaxID=3345760 RepID=UPI0035DCBBB4